MHVNEQHMSAVAEYGLGIVMVRNDCVDRNLLLQYYTEEQLELLARSDTPTHLLKNLKLEDVLADQQEFIDLSMGKREFNEQEYKKEIYEKYGALLS